MLYLTIVSFIWAASFGLIKKYLAGVDAGFVSFARLAVSLAVFLPFLRTKNIGLKFSARLFLIGAVQYGLMYIFYMYSFRFLKGYQVALFTLLTPLYVSLINDGFRKKFDLRGLSLASLAVLGGAIIVYSPGEMKNIFAGFMLVQASNISFAFGQVFYRETAAKYQFNAAQIFAVIYFGGALTAGIYTGINGGFSASAALSARQIAVLVYLGAVASGLGFFMWNIGATKVSAPVLAVFNNVKIPLAVICSLLIFGEQVNMVKLFIGGAVIVLALYLSKFKQRRV
ncbi:MAG: EamA family transporter [Elusimicrobia bacterium]|nr:EamA family transporter [Elusimicrobiota bacterium]